MPATEPPQVSSRHADGRFMLETFSTPDRDVIEGVGTRIRFAAGDVLTSPDDPSRLLYLLLSGEVVVTVAAGSEEYVLAQARGGQFIGEVSWFSGAPRSATARVKGAGEALTFPPAALGQLLAQAPRLAVQMLSALAYTLATRVERLARQRYWVTTDAQPTSGKAASRSQPSAGSSRLAATPRQARAAFVQAAAYRGLPLNAAEALCAVAQPLRVLDGQTLVHQGESGDAILLPATASLLVRAEIPGQPPLELGIVQPGDVAGEVSVFTGGPRSASLIATFGGVVLALSEATLERFCRESPVEAAAFLSWVCGLLAARVVQATAALTQAAEGSDHERLQRWLSLLATRPRWNQHDVDWTSHVSLDRTLEQVMARFINDIRAAEEGAEWLAERLIDDVRTLVPEEYYRAFYARQHDEETLHAATLARYVELLGGSRGVPAALPVAQRMNGLDERLFLLLLGEELALATSRVLAATYPDPLLRQILGYIMVDEATHVAFAHRLLQRRLRTRRRLQRLRLVVHLTFTRATLGIGYGFLEYHDLLRVTKIPLGRLYLYYLSRQARRVLRLIWSGDLERVIA